MAPTCPEEVDVFTIPHSRMKELVNKYLDRLMQTNFDNEVHLTSLLESLCLTFREFIAHEQIENKFIMKKLKNRMRALSIQDSAVCNCHKDNQLIDMLTLFEDGYKCTKKSDADRSNYGLKLRHALEEFTQTFLPHMAEEEQVFQPLLMQHFSVEELKQIKATVLQQHFKIEPADIPQEKFVEDNVSAKGTSEPDLIEPRSSFDDLSNEMVLQIFSYLNPLDLCKTAQVSTRFNKLAMDRSLWTQLFPVSWANGLWDAEEGMYEEDSESDVSDKLEAKVFDEDADVDESDSIEEWDTEALAIQRQSFMLTSICKYLLPRVGACVQHCDLAYSKGLTNGTLYKILSLCPNLEYLDLTQTRISDLGFKGINKNGFGKKLKHLDLTGCLYITDLTLERLAPALSQMTGHMTDSDHMAKDSNDVILESSEKEVINEGEPVTEENSATVDSNENVDNKEVNTVTKTLEPDNENSYKHMKTCCKEKGSHDKSIDNNSKTKKEEENEKSTPRHEACCQNTPGCMKNHSNGKKEKPYKTDCSYAVDTAKMKETEWRNKASEDVDTSAPEKILKRLIRCVCCGKVDEIIDGFAEEAEDYGICYQERPSNHGNQVCCCHGRASVATDRGTCCPGRAKLKRNISFDETDNRGSNSCCFTCMETVSHRCQGTGTLKGQGHSHVDPNDDQENIIDNPKTETAIGEYGFRTRNDDFPDKSDTPDQESGSKSDIPGWGTKDTGDLESPAMLENQIPLSETNTYLEESWLLNNLGQVQIIGNREESGTSNDVGPFQTELPMMFIMDDLDLKFGMKNPDENRNKSNDISPEQRVILAESEMKIDGPPLEFLSLSGCYQITDAGLSYLAENDGLPNLKFLELSGCLNLTGPGIAELVDTCSRLDPSSLFYCDNMLDGPFPEAASGCQNLQCATRVCCRSGE